MNDAHPLTRRSILAMGAAAAATPLLGRAAAAANSDVTLDAKPKALSDETLAAYAAKSGVTPSVVPFDSDELLFSNLLSPNGVNSDVLVPSSQWIHHLRERKLLLPLDLSRLPVASLNPALLNRNYDPERTYALPKDWGVLGVVYDPDVVGEIKTWQDFYDAGAKPGVTKKIRMSKIPYQMVGPVLWLQGKDWNTVSVDDAVATKDFLTGFAKNIKAFTRFDPKALSTGAIVMAMASQIEARAALQVTPKLKWVVPGPTSEIWFDTYTISAQSTHVDQAYDLINYLLSADAQLRETTYFGYPGALSGLEGRLEADVPLADMIFGGKDIAFDRLTTYVLDSQLIDKYQDVTNAVVAAAFA